MGITYTKYCAVCSAAHPLICKPEREHLLAPSLRYVQCKYCGNTEHWIYKDFDSSGPYNQESVFSRKNVENKQLNPYFNEKKYKKYYKALSKKFPSDPVKTSPPKPKASSSTSQPKCPTCGSTNVNPISTTKRIASGLTLGIFSSSFGKSYECRDCKYKW